MKDYSGLMIKCIFPECRFKKSCWRNSAPDSPHQHFRSFQTNSNGTCDHYIKVKEIENFSHIEYISGNLLGE